jgi:hypothetical protein
VISFFDELEKIAVRVPFLHGTSGKWDVLKAGIGKSILSSDPNTRAVYVATKRRKSIAPVSHFARSAVKSRGGEPVLAVGKIDTKKGWLPASLTAQARRDGVALDDVKDVVSTIDRLPSRSERGSLWRMINNYVGAWRNENTSATIRPRRYVRAT